MVIFIVLILTMPGVKWLVHVEIINEYVCRLLLSLSPSLSLSFSVLYSSVWFLNGCSPKY